MSNDLDQLTIKFGDLSVSFQRSKGAAIPSPVSTGNAGSSNETHFSSNNVTQSTNVTAASSAILLPSYPCKFYVITANPGDPSLVGIVYGEMSSVWNKIEQRLSGNRLAGSGATLVRVTDLQAARDVWSKRWKVGLPGSPSTPPLIMI